jgi:hypothetical protein
VPKRPYALWAVWTCTCTLTFRTYILLLHSKLKMKAERSSETLVRISKSKQRHYPEGNIDIFTVVRTSNPIRKCQIWIKIKLKLNYNFEFKITAYRSKSVYPEVAACLQLPGNSPAPFSSSHTCMHSTVLK